MSLVWPPRDEYANDPEASPCKSPEKLDRSKFSLIHDSNRTPIQPINYVIRFINKPFTCAHVRTVGVIGSFKLHMPHCDKSSTVGTRFFYVQRSNMMKQVLHRKKKKPCASCRRDRINSFHKTGLKFDLRIESKEARNLV